MKACSELCVDPGFYLKTITCILCGCATYILSSTELDIFRMDVEKILVPVTCGTFAIVNLSLLLTYSSEDDMHLAIWLFSLIGGSMLTASSTVLLYDVLSRLNTGYQGEINVVTVTALCIFSGLCLLIDTIREVCRYNKGRSASKP